MNIFTIFLTNINKYGIKFLSLILIYELINIYRLRFGDYFVVKPVKKKNEPCVPSPYYCLNLIEKYFFEEKFIFIDFGCGKGRVLDYIKKNKNIKNIIGIDNNKNFKDNLLSINSSKLKFYFNDCMDKIFVSFLSKKFKKENLILYFYHPFSEKTLNKLLHFFLKNNKKKIKIVILGKIFLSKKLIKNFKLKKLSLHKMLNIYDYKNH